MRLAERAERLKAAVCEAARAATTAQSRMQPLENAETYMRLALLATQARAAKLALDEAAAAAGDAIAQLVTDQLANQEAQNQSNAATARGQAGAPAAEHLDMHFDHTDAVDVTNAGDLLREAKAAADAAQAAAAAAISIRSSPAVGQARSAATKAQAASGSAALMPGLIHAAAANPPPLSCADAATFANRITALRNASATLAVGQAADPGVSGARAQAFLNQVDAVEGVLQQADPQMNGVAHDNVDVRQQNQNLMAISTQTGNAFRRDFEKANRLLAGGTGLATRAAQAANDANAGVQALHAPAISLPPAITSLRATLDTIETEAQAASLLIPYDPAANSNNAMTAIDQFAIAEGAFDDLSRQLANVQRQARSIAHERAEKRSAANRLVISRKIAVYNAVKRAEKQSWGSWLVEQCPLIGRESEATKAARLLEQAQEAYDTLGCSDNLGDSHFA